ncbi:hypothetical protein [Microbulbifer spongiae]|uniref:START domain-containing protein n=1 Tax=Microbulbifer spongiae TaxID=2944933 RepID=A0ABY9ECE2_9GAMM|nr:hypothetical protein [Microbulbifer sp. MI-G]WKD49184.1 hypothetical protein M8T91_14970 [Microbulbifer sp. MI-G]
MSSEIIKSTVKPLVILKKIGRYIGIIFFVIVLVAIAWLIYFTYSGTGEWQLIREDNGVQVYSLKEPGTTLMRFKSSTKVNATLGAFVKMIHDPNACGSFCHDGKLIEQVADNIQYSSYKTNMPLWFKRREKLVMIHTQQNPETGQVVTNIIAAPNRSERDPCCLRTTHKHNIWTMTPMENGQVKVEFVFDEDFGGNMPGFLVNSVMKKYMYRVMYHMQSLLDRELYKDATVDFIQEP